MSRFGTIEMITSLKTETERMMEKEHIIKDMKDEVEAGQRKQELEKEQKELAQKQLEQLEKRNNDNQKALEESEKRGKALAERIAEMEAQEIENKKEMERLKTEIDKQKPIMGIISRGNNKNIDNTKETYKKLEIENKELEKKISETYDEYLTWFYSLTPEVQAKWGYWTGGVSHLIVNIKRKLGSKTKDEARRRTEVPS